ncbi:hypothetical protein HHUSO_G29915 [Huso huso]|uniref:Uncharacterized protein n=1 Tax=Huso huso TaxID=61971 RepID=A0ABR0YEE8_HUSHU
MHSTLNMYLQAEVIRRMYNQYKFHHFFSVCFGFGCGLVSYRPYYSLTMPIVLTVFFTLVFELVGMSFGLPAHTTRCKGKPYNRSDAYFGLCIALGVALLNLDTNYGKWYIFSCFFVKCRVSEFHAIISEACTLKS